MDAMSLFGLHALIRRNCDRRGPTYTMEDDRMFYTVSVATATFIAANVSYVQCVFLMLSEYNSGKSPCYVIYKKERVT